MHTGEQLRQEQSIVLPIAKLPQACVRKESMSHFPSLSGGLLLGELVMRPPPFHVARIGNICPRSAVYRLEQLASLDSQQAARKMRKRSSSPARKAKAARIEERSKADMKMRFCRQALNSRDRFSAAIVLEEDLKEAIQ